jgi:HPt (histidine-containing phosphotransfer) domain-containing protein
LYFDLHLQDCSGPALQAHFQTVARSSGLPVFSDGRPARVREPGVLAGFSRVLPKPFSAGQLRAIVDQALVNRALAQFPAIASTGEAVAVSAAGKLERALRAEWVVGLAELDQHVAALDWSKATYVLHRLRGAAAVAGFPELARGARRLMDEIAKEVVSLELTSAYSDFLWQGANFTMLESGAPASIRRCESAVPCP